jgi:hypothetical protein
LPPGCISLAEDSLFATKTFESWDPRYSPICPNPAETGTHLEPSCDSVSLSITALSPTRQHHLSRTTTPGSLFNVLMLV